MKYAKLGSVIVAGTLALSMGLVGCGSNAAKTDTTTQESTEQTTEAAQAPVEVTTEEQVQNNEGEALAPEEQTKVTATDEEQVTVTDEEAAKIAELEETNKGNIDMYGNWYEWYDYYVADMRGWSRGFYGNTNTGLDLYYAENANGTKACLFVVDSSTNRYWSYVGDVVTLSDGGVAIVDNYSGRSFCFRADYADDYGNVYISLGNYGSGVFTQCNVSDIIAAMDAIETYGYNLDYWVY